MMKIAKNKRPEARYTIIETEVKVGSFRKVFTQSTEMYVVFWNETPRELSSFDFSPLVAICLFHLAELLLSTLLSLGLKQF